jgi:hypothetical protein
MAVAGPDYGCIYADVGTNGRVADGGVWNMCSLSKSIDDVTISFPSRLGAYRLVLQRFPTYLWLMMLLH